MAYADIDKKKFLNSDGLAYLLRKLNNYPGNEIIPNVIIGLQEAIAQKQDVIRADTTANWNSKIGFVPAKGEIIIYFDKATAEVGGETIIYPGIKIGDGMAYCVDLPFLGDELAASMFAHINDYSAHVSSADRIRWNNKLNCTVDDETLVLDRN